MNYTGFRDLAQRARPGGIDGRFQFNPGFCELRQAEAGRVIASSPETGAADGEREAGFITGAESDYDFLSAGAGSGGDSGVHAEFDDDDYGSGLPAEDENGAYPVWQDEPLPAAFISIGGRLLACRGAVAESRPRWWRWRLARTAADPGVVPGADVVAPEQHSLFTIRLKLSFILVALAALFCLHFTDPAAAADRPWIVHETAVSTGSGDQLAPDLDGDAIVYMDRSVPGMDRLMRKHIDGGPDEELLSSGALWAGPAAADGGFAWQDGTGAGCLRIAGGVPDRCIAAPQASAMALSGTKAVISDSGSTIRLLDFDTMRSRMLDSYASPGMRYDPDIEGGTVVWVKERGYAGQYFEPLITSYDLETGVSTYLTKTGGGQSSGGSAKYQRRHPSISNGRVAYQQRLNETGEQWDIYLTEPDTYGVAAVQEYGDQINPSLSGDIVVYQDNRAGHYDDAGNWIDDWNIYLKDLSTNIEQPVCTAAGDQINPVVKGNLIVWQDSRDGNWDVYAAQLTPAAEPPQLNLSIDSVLWQSYQDYADRDLTVVYGLRNSGAGPAANVALTNIATSPGDVVWIGTSPAGLSALNPGEAAQMELRYSIPEGVVQFFTKLQASCQDGDGAELLFPATEPGQ